MRARSPVDLSAHPSALTAGTASAAAARARSHRPGHTLLAGAALLAIVLAGALSTGCRTTALHERGRQQHRAMAFDADGGSVYIRTKIEAAREGAFGGYGAAASGGCGCQ